jgi:hypothetical protein
LEIEKSRKKANVYYSLCRSLEILKEVYAQKVKWFYEINYSSRKNNSNIFDYLFFKNENFSKLIYSNRDYFLYCYYYHNFFMKKIHNLFDFITPKPFKDNLEISLRKVDNVNGKRSSNNINSASSINNKFISFNSLKEELKTDEDFTEFPEINTSNIDVKNFKTSLISTSNSMYFLGLLNNGKVYGIDTLKKTFKSDTVPDFVNCSPSELINAEVEHSKILMKKKINTHSPKRMISQFAIDRNDSIDSLSTTSNSLSSSRSSLTSSLYSFQSLESNKKNHEELKISLYDIYKIKPIKEIDEENLNSEKSPKVETENGDDEKEEEEDNSSNIEGDFDNFNLNSSLNTLYMSFFNHSIHNIYNMLQFSKDE